VPVENRLPLHVGLDLVGLVRVVDQDHVAALTGAPPPTEVAMR
jgi:hypothetical protein